MKTKISREKIAELRKAHLEQMESFKQDPAVMAEYHKFSLQYAIAEELYKARKQAGMSQSELAEKIQTSQSCLTKIEQGRDVKLSTLEKYAAACGKRLIIKLA